MPAAPFAIPNSHPYRYATCDSNPNSDSDTNAQSNSDTFARASSTVEYLDAVAG